jgi:integrase
VTRPAGLGKPRNYLKPEELRAFFLAIRQDSFFPTSMVDRPFWYAYFLLQYRFGCRLSEPALIRNSDIDKLAGTISIRRLKKEKEPNGYREHKCGLDFHALRVVTAVEEWKRGGGYEDNPFLFAARRRRDSQHIGDERLSKLRDLDGWQSVSRFTTYRTFCRLATAAKIPHELQQAGVLRHTRSVVLLAQGHTVEEVRQILGHSATRITKKYLPAAEQLSYAYTATAVGEDLTL